MLPRTLRLLSDNMLTRDNPDHRRLRRLVEQAFSRHSVEDMRGRIGVLCDGLLDGLAGRETVDLLAEWARRLPVAVICELLGLPDEDRPKFTRWAKALVVYDVCVWPAAGLARDVQAREVFPAAIRAMPATAAPRA